MATKPRAPAKVKRGKTAGIPFRQTRAPHPVCLLAIGLPEVAALVASRVQSIGRARGCCAFVFVRAGAVYVISEESSAASQWATERIAEWVGCYGGLVDEERLAEDLAEHAPAPLTP